MLNLDIILKPKKTLKFDTIEIDIEGMTIDAESAIELLKTRKCETEEEFDKIRREYVKKVISYSVKDIRGLSINGQPFVLKFKPNEDIEQLTDESYNLLMIAINKKLAKDLLTPVHEFYESVLKDEYKEQLFEVESDKKKE